LIEWRAVRCAVCGVPTKPNQNGSLETKDAAPPLRFLPEFVRIPTIGGDAITGLSRSWWMNAEARGLIALHRIRKPGGKCRPGQMQSKPTVLLPVAAAIALVNRLSTKDAA
jgi:hypothetical protein